MLIYLTWWAKEPQFVVTTRVIPDLIRVSTEQPLVGYARQFEYIPRVSPWHHRDVIHETSATLHQQRTQAYLGEQLQQLLHSNYLKDNTI